MFHLPTGDATTAHSRAGPPRQGNDPIQAGNTSGGADRRSFATVFTDMRARDQAGAVNDTAGSVVPAHPDTKDDAAAQDQEVSEVSVDDPATNRGKDSSLFPPAFAEAAGSPDDLPADLPAATEQGTGRGGPPNEDPATSGPHAGFATGRPDTPVAERPDAQASAEAAHLSRQDGAASSHAAGPDAARDPATVFGGPGGQADQAEDSSEDVGPARIVPGAIAGDRPASSNAELLAKMPSPAMRRQGAERAALEMGQAASSSVDPDITASIANNAKVSLSKVAEDGPGVPSLTPGEPPQSSVNTAASRVDLADGPVTVARAAEGGPAPNAARPTLDTQAANASNDAAPRLARAGSLDVPAGQTRPNPSNDTQAEPAATVRDTGGETRDAGSANRPYSRGEQPAPFHPGPQSRPEQGLTRAKAPARAPAGTIDRIAPAAMVRPEQALENVARPTPGTVEPAEKLERAPSAPSPSVVAAPAAPVAPTPPVFAARNPVLPAEERVGDTLDETGRTSPSSAHTSQVETSAPLRQSSLAAATRGPDLPRHVIEQLTTGFRGAGDKSAEIHLNPAELGRVRISLQTGDAGVLVSVMADRPETLDLLRRHADMLAQDFRDIGYGAAQFSFGQSGHPRSGQGRGPEGDAIGPVDAALTEDQAPATHPQVGHASIALDRVDIRL
ncbi:Flagellar hook-length control protein FliK [Roseovarius sp. THAF27]|uniref:flagellar hook-length control protein FliK n=1 Tax=Roseovarius sp. THAF27 TaxID=2587850 RepID=UPI001268C924|nr:flagellar hook-length control protein FliK [Roseovarius sp. THAF27]QFT83081.1 Flagellar hook-length control protein FliK [Roseovarius sp. THAF27]